MQNFLTPQQKTDYLLKKYTKRDYNLTDLTPKYAVYFNPSIEKINDWNFICACNTIEEAKKEILWRKNYEIYGDGDLVLDNDSRFSTFRDETKNVDQQGITYEPTQALMNINYGNGANALQVIANSSSQVPEKNGFRGMAYYTGPNMETDYKGFYKIEEIYEI
jgi:hypothetical protein